MPCQTTLDWARFGAVLFDLDGVITPTAEIHQRAWAALFAPFDYSPSDYLTFIDGKSRYEGVQSFLESRHVHLPWGDADDKSGDGSICALGNRKNDMFNGIVAEEPIVAYPGTVALIDLLDELGTPQAVVSSSRNARAVLRAAGMADRFAVVIDGETAVAEQLASKPAPDGFLRAAELLGVDRSVTAVIEDAVAGVAAGKAGCFGFVLGVDRGGNAEALRAAGASAVVGDLAETLKAVQA